MIWENGELNLGFKRFEWEWVPCIVTIFTTRSGSWNNIQGSGSSCWLQNQSRVLWWPCQEILAPGVSRHILFCFWQCDIIIITVGVHPVPFVLLLLFHLPILCNRFKSAGPPNRGRVRNSSRLFVVLIAFWRTISKHTLWRCFERQVKHNIHASQHAVNLTRGAGKYGNLQYKHIFREK